MIRFSAVVALALLPTTAVAATLTVGPSGTYATVDAALSAAAAGDTIAIEAGAYPEPRISVAFDLSIEGAGRAITTLYAAFGGDFIEVTAGTLTLRNLTVNANDNRAVEVVDASLALDDVLITDAFVNTSGGGVYAQNSSIVVAGSRFFDNEVLVDGGHIHATDCSVLLIDTDFSAGRARFGGAVNAVGGSLDIVGGVFEDNRGSGTFEAAGGGAIYGSGLDLVVDGSSFVTNVAASTYFLGGGDAWGGAIYVLNGSATLRDTVFDRNRNVAQLLARGGALAAADSPVWIERSIFDGNWLGDADDLGEGGAIWLSASPLTMSDSTVMNGTSQSTIAATGGGIHAEDSDLVISGANFVSNSVLGPTADGGGIYVRGTGDTITVSDSVFSGNVADGLGGGLHAGDVAGILGSVELDQCSFSGNTAASGGAVYSASPADLTVLSSAFTGNSATDSGGAIHSTGSGAVDASLFANNSASSGGGIDAVGSLVLTSVRFHGNTATSIGGGLTLGGGALDLSNSVFCGNDAVVGGAAALGASGASSVANTVFADGSATMVGGGLWVDGLGIDVDLDNNTFVGNSGGTGGALYTDEAGIDAVNNLIAWTATGDGWVATTGLAAPAGYTLWFGNNAVDAVGVSLSDDRFGDPLLSGYTGDCAVDNYRPALGSAAIDAGDPSILDTDGSTSDIGAFGGPSPQIDVDGDGFPRPLDCEDTHPTEFPGAVDVPYDGIDQDCLHGDLCDVDLDGADDVACGGADCDDDDIGIYPGATDIPYDGIDQDCSGADACDLDLDGFDGQACGGLDCDDDDPAINPTIPEIAYDGIDQDCDGADLCDLDGDGEDALVCGGPDCDDDDPDLFAGNVEIPYDGIDQNCDGVDLCDVDGDGWDDGRCYGTDCDDTRADTYPNAPEVPYDGVDQDCNGADLCDVDGDGYADPLCGGDDCDDDDVDAFPGAPEVPGDGIDQDCDGADACDWDGDGYDAAGCGGDDCDDTEAAVFPGAVEIAGDGIDQDCDGADLCDEDGDGHDHLGCGGDDCVDTDAAAHPGAVEVPYDGIDQDCDGADLCDVDQDGEDDLACGGADCDDADATVLPGEIDVPYDGIDQDCSGSDFCDVDGDGVDAVVCGGGDCDDEDPAVSSAATEVPYDGIDQDCDGADLCDVDDDGSDAPDCGGNDCADEEPSIHPGAVDTPDDHIDQDCDGFDASNGDDTGLKGGKTEPGGCECDSGRSPASWMLLLVCLVVTRRRHWGR